MWSIILLSFTVCQVLSQATEPQKDFGELCYPKRCYRWSGTAKGYREQLNTMSSVCGNSSQLLEIHDYRMQSEVTNFILDYNNKLPGKFAVLLNLRHRRNVSEWRWTSGVIAEAIESEVDDHGFLDVDNNNLTIKFDKHDQHKSFICRINSPCSMIHQRNNLFQPSTENSCLLPCSRQNCFYTWHQSRNLCLGIGGDLAHFADISLEKELTKWLNKLQLGTLPVKQFWIGLHRGSWFWGSSGNEAKFTNWAPREPLAFPHLISHHFSDSLYLPFFTLESNREWSTIRSAHQLHHVKFTFICFREKNHSITRQVLETYRVQSAVMSATDVPQQPLSQEKAASLGLLVIMVIIITCTASTVCFGSLAGVYMFRKRRETAYSRETTLSRSRIE